MFLIFGINLRNIIFCAIEERCNVVLGNFFFFLQNYHGIKKRRPAKFCVRQLFVPPQGCDPSEGSPPYHCSLLQHRVLGCEMLFLALNLSTYCLVSFK